MRQEDLRIIHKTREDYNRIAQYFANTRQHVWAELKPLERYIKDGDVVLDWGCGNGRLVTMLNDKKIQYIGIDQSEELLEIAKQNFAEEIRDGWVQFFSNAEKEKEFPDNFFDIVFMIASFHHLPSRDSRVGLLKQLHREIKSGGKLIITVWNLESEWAKNKLQNGWKQIGENDVLVPWKTQGGEVLVERYYHHFSPEELGALLQETGFTVEQLEFVEKIPTPDKKGGRNLIAIASK